MARSINRLLFNIVCHQQPVLQNSFRCYGRWAHRKPAKVLLPFEANTKTDLKQEKVIDLDPPVLKKSAKQSNDLKKLKNEDKPQLSKDKDESISDKNINFLEIKEKRDEKLKKRKFFLSQSKVFDENNEIIYEKLKENDGRISSMLIKLKSKKERLRSGQTLVEGWRLIVDGLQAKCKLNYIVFSRVEDLHNIRPFLPKTGIKIYKIPYKEIELWSDVETPSGILGVFETPKPDSVKSQSKPLPLNFICDNIRVPGNLGAILRAAVGVGCEKVFLTKGCVDLWDPKVIRSAAGAHFRLPVYQSLDWEQLPKLLENETSIFIADSNTKFLNDTDEMSEDIEGMKIPVLPYYSVEFASLKHITLVIGGETEGISEESYQLAAERNGLRLNIPIQRGVDSLNTGMAAAVIAFEIRKQLISAWTKEKLARKVAEAT